ncbi:MAG: helix-hairpin-helix domain-containing protein [Acidobacteriota bacterium]|nr:helix-hairpin-helix domain-containing protein [Acidobacteriota bacterium]
MYRDLTSRLLRAALALFCVALALAANVACVKLPRRARVEGSSVSASPAQQSPPTAFGNKPAPAHPIDINRAAPEELARLPGIGEGLAARIVEHRARYGAFRRAEHLLMVRGIGERRFERLRPYVTVE